MLKNIHLMKSSQNNDYAEYLKNPRQWEFSRMNVRNVDIFSDEEVKTHVHLLRHRVDESKL